MRLSQLIEQGATRAVRAGGVAVDLTVGSFTYDQLRATDWEEAAAPTVTINREQLMAAFNAVRPQGGSVAAAPEGQFFSRLAARLGI